MKFTAPLSRLGGIACLAVGLLLGGMTATWAQAPSVPDAKPPAVDNQAPDDSAGDTAAVEMTIAARPTVILSGTAEWEDGLRAIMDSFDKIRAEMGKAGLQPGGRPIAVFEETDDRGFRFEAMIPLASEPAGDVKLEQEVHVGTSPAGRTMKFEHRGSYDDIDTTYEAITAYLDDKGLEAQNMFIEEYLNTPDGMDDPDLQVDIYVFLK